MQRSTNNIGGDCNEKTSVRVHHAPGGASTFSLSHEQPEIAPAGRSRNFQQQQSSFSLGWDTSTSQKVNQQQTNKNVQTSVKVSNNPGGAQGFSINQQENKLGSQAPVHTSVHVKNPPGGRSQITFG